MKSHVTEDVLTHVHGNVYHLAPIPIGWRVLSEEEQQDFHEDLVAVARERYTDDLLDVPDERHIEDLGSVPPFPQTAWRERYGAAVGVWHRVPTNNILHLADRRPVAVLRNAIKDLHREVATEAGEEFVDTEFLESWIQFYQNGDRKVLHNHERYDHPFIDNMWVGAYYIDDGAPENDKKYSGVLSFRIRNENYLFRPVPGLLMLWPYDLLHEVHPFYGSRHRIVVNFHVRGV
jgi:hypothetical protein